MAAETHGGESPFETIQVGPEVHERLRGWSDADRADEELLEELLDHVELTSGTTAWPSNDYY